MTRTRTLARAVPVALAAALLLAACASDGEPDGGTPTPDDAVAAPADDEGAGEAEAVGDEDAEGEDAADDMAADAAAGDACELVTMQAQGKVFGVELPEPDATDWGAGFTECIWENDGGKVLRVSVVPAEDYRADYVEQLTTVEVASFDGVGFAGIVGIGHASSGGFTVGFERDGNGVLVAVDTQGASNDAAVAVEIAEEIRAG